MKVISERVKKYLSEMHLSFDSFGSYLSGSEYIEINGPNDSVIKIRISNHNLPPTYMKKHGESDYEIGDYDEGCDWKSVLRAIATRLDIQLPNGVLTAIKRAENKATKKRVEKNKAEAVARTAHQKNQDDLQLTIQFMPPEAQERYYFLLAKKNSLSGIKRKRQNTKLKNLLCKYWVSS